MLANLPCLSQWSSDRIDHIGSLALARRNAFTNSQWALAGAQLLEVRYRSGAPFVADPSHLMRPARCGDGPARLHLATSIAPKAFDYLWLVDLPRSAWPRDPRLVPVWRGERGLLLRRVSEIDTYAGRTAGKKMELPEAASRMTSIDISSAGRMPLGSAKSPPERGDR